MNNTTRIEVGYNTDLFEDIEGKALLSEIRDFGIDSIKEVSTAKVFTFSGLSVKQIQIIKEKLLIEPLWIREVKKTKKNGSQKIEIQLKPGVTNTEIDSILKAINDLGINVHWGASGRIYELEGKPTHTELDKIATTLLFNKTIEKVVDTKNTQSKPDTQSTSTKTIPISTFNDAQLVKFSKDNLLFLSLHELKVIQKYFLEKKRDPTDCEIETLAQTWSEHNYHKTFKARLKINGKLKQSLIKRIQQATAKIAHKDALVVFSDNAGVVAFDGKYALCAKTETHNSPSAIEPYGGAMTGVGGVLRDIAGTGLGAKNIAATDVFCFGFPETKDKDVPKGCLHPKRVMQKCIKGVRDYGNRMGVPTVNGSLNFDPDYRAKPVVLVGAVGILPKTYAKKGKIKAGDLVVTVGGKTGRDGIHGATFSSGEMSDNTASIAQSAVQIGNPIEEKRMFDALIEARDKNLIKYITDCGGGGYSSSIGELAKDHGVTIDLSLVPLKYEGLKPWEIWLSEAQERMTVILGKKNWSAFRKICQKYNSQTSIIGSLTNTKRLNLFYKNIRIADLDMQFLHDGVPQQTLQGKKRKLVKKKSSSKKLSLDGIVEKILKHPNIASKEEIVRRYDHEVQGRLILKPFVGRNFDAPTDAAIIKPLFNSQKGVAIAHGLQTKIAKRDPNLGAIYAVDECIRNLVVTGVNPDKIFLLDNFIFPKIDPFVIYDLDKSVDGLCKAALVFKSPFISGKDSLSGTYKDKKHLIQVPPTICVSGVGIVDDIEKSVSSDFKKSGSLIILLGQKSGSLGGSVYEEITDSKEVALPPLNLKKAKKIYNVLHKLITKEYVLSAHDVSEGGIFVAISEMCFGSNKGVSMDLPKTGDPLQMFFSEIGGRIIVEIAEKNLLQFENIAKGIDYHIIGRTSETGILSIQKQKKTFFKKNIADLKSIWKSTFQKYF